MAVLATFLTLTINSRQSRASAPLAEAPPPINHPTDAMKEHLIALTGFAVLTLSTAAQADPPSAAPPAAAPPAAKVAGRVVVISPDGKRQEFSFGNPSGEQIRDRIGNGGAHLELKLAPDREALARLKAELEETFEDHGVGGELLDKVFAALENLDGLAAVQVRGLAVGPDRERKEFEFKFGDDVGVDAEQLDKKMEAGGAQLELGVETAERTNDLLGLLVHAPESLQLLEKGLRNPDTIKLLNEIVSNPELMKFFENAADDPDLLSALRRGLEDPLISGLLTRGLQSEGAANLLKFFGGAAKPTPEAPAPQVPAPQVPAPQVPAPQVPAPQVPAPQVEPPSSEAPAASASHPKIAERVAELDELRRELADQRALLEAILKKLE